jgi:heme oxygenase
MVSAPLAPPLEVSISDHATAADARQRRGFGPRIRRLHGRIGMAHHQAEGMAFSRSLLNGAATPLQLAALIRALEPAYALLEDQAPAVAARLGASGIPWPQLQRHAALQHDVANLVDLAATPVSPAATAWLERLQALAEHAPHRLMAHVYVRYGGDLSGGQQLAEHANQILAAEALPVLRFWRFEQPIGELKVALHDGFEALALTDVQEQELLEESELAFLLTQRLLAELEDLHAAVSPAAA